MKNEISFRFIGIILIAITFFGCEKDIDIDEELLSVETYSFTFNQKEYLLVQEASSWEDAVEYAIAKGGYLAEINSYEEQIAIFTQITDFSNITFDQTNNEFGYAAIWLGANDLETEGTWIWNGDNNETQIQFWSGGVDGEALNNLYNNWGNEPDNNGDQDVLSMSLEATPINNAGEWTDLNGSTNNLFFLVEYD